MIMMKARNNGHKPNDGDKFQPLRIENEILRCMYFGEDSLIVLETIQIKKGTNKVPFNIPIKIYYLKEFKSNVLTPSTVYYRRNGC